MLAASGSQQWRQTVDERRLACFLAELLAIGPKDRSACDLLIIVDFNASLDKKGMGKWTNEQLAAGGDQSGDADGGPHDRRVADGRDEEVLGRDDAQGERPAGDASCFA